MMTQPSTSMGSGTAPLVATPQALAGYVAYPSCSYYDNQSVSCLPVRGYVRYLISNGVVVRGPATG